MPTPDFECLFRATPAALMVLSPDGPDFPILAGSDAYARATLTEAAAIEGRSVFEVFPDNPADPSANGVGNLRAALQRVVDSGEPDTMAVQKYDIRRPDNPDGPFEARYWSCINVPVFDAAGRLSAIIHRAEDVTDLINAERRSHEQQAVAEALRSRAGRMEVEVFRRAQEIQEVNHRLAEANVKLGRLDQIKNDFFASVSHEFRTPLALILGPVESLLAAPGTSSALARTLQLVARNARLLQSHVNDLLDITRLDAGRLRLHYAELDAGRFLKLAASHFELAAVERAIRFQVDAPEALLAQIDPARLQRVLVNLLSNAFQFVPVGGVVRCAVGTTDDEQTLVLTVADSGPGIPEKDRASVFDRFTHVDTTGTRRAGGMGLGLSIVKSLVELHGGAVSIGAAPEGGALMTVVLPRWAPGGVAVEVSDRYLDAIDPHAGSDFRARLAKGRNGSFGSGDDRPTVLVAEDNADMNRFICEVLADEYLIVSVFDAASALEEARYCQPDAIVSDVMMPGLSTSEFLKRLRADPGLADIPVMLLTAKADEASRIAALRQGARDYLLKPFNSAELKARVANLIAMRRQVSAGNPAHQERLQEPL